MADDAPITRLADVRRMTPHEIVAAKRAGRLDMKALRHEQATDRDTARRARLTAVRMGITVPQALELINDGHIKPGPGTPPDAA